MVAVTAVAVDVVATAVNVDRSVKVRVTARAPTASHKKHVSRVPKASNGRSVVSAANAEAATVAPSAKPSRKARKFAPCAQNAPSVLIAVSRVVNVAPVASVRIAMPSSNRKPPPCPSKPI